ncbi:MAG: 50S ribosomal protein L33 [Bombilactobacillus mellifer]|nr:50S ribosomal protein L33 [Bombilactobacillus mellifer]MBH9991606.1 50S ribosomal protein L33 [Lactobacillus sp. W8092]MCT6825845.1 50S ribosomal protein L33 [Bombilactobacillus mellifer]MCT6843766.1 50S ribosomal protein L33 [Bombilactobacillus mellifer]MCT6894214.1 50S ribosomal protein L33 [Bombilactobacillus mellifer]
MKAKKITLQCSICGAHNYHPIRNTEHTERMTIKKYCPHCRRHTIHQETR